MRPIRTLIVDDEELARERIRTLVAGDALIEVVGECTDGREAVAAIRNSKPDLVFLDVQMPELDGFEVLRQVGPDAVPVVVFVTAFDEYALQAFEFVALDYLLKPFTSARFDRALTRAKDQIQRGDDETIRRQLGDLLKNAGRGHLDRIVVKEAGRISFMRAREIRWIEAQGNYVKLHSDAEAHLVRRSMRELEDRLDPEAFLRIHRSFIVNVDAIRELQPLAHGEYRVELRDGTVLTSNRTFKRNLERLF